MIDIHSDRYTEATFLVGLKATLDKIGMPKGKISIIKILGHFFVCLVFGERYRKKKRGLSASKDSKLVDILGIL